MGWTVSLKTAVFAALTAWLCLPSLAQAQIGTIGTDIPVCTARVKQGDSFSRLIAGKIPLNCGDDQKDQARGDFWAASGPLDIAASHHDGDLRLRQGSVWQQAVTIGVVRANGHIDWFHADSRQFSRHIQLGAVAEFAIPAGNSPITKLVWRIDGSANVRAILQGVSIATARQSNSSNLYLGMLYAAFGGLALALFVYNLALWGALRHGFQLSYCLLLGMLMVYALSSSGALAWIVDGIDNNNRLRINYLSLACAAVASLIFTRRYFEPRVFEGGLEKLTASVSAALFLSGMGLALAPASWVGPLDFAYLLAFTALISILPLIIWRAYIERSRFLWIFALAWSAPMAMAVIRIFSVLHLLPWSFWIDNSTLVAISAEALLSSLAIAYRISLLTKERDQAVADGAVDRLLAATDPLTGLLNRRAFLEEAVGRSGRQQLLLLDIDHFKRVNDTQGHDVGDEVLRMVARLLLTVTPASGLVARIGGEEFALLTDMQDAIDAEAVLATLRNTQMPRDLTITGSIGGCVGSLTTNADWRSLYRQADQALYEAKTGGRDRVRMNDALAIAA